MGKKKGKRMEEVHIDRFTWTKKHSLSEEAKQVLTNNDAAFQCNFLFNIFFILWMLYVSIELFHQIPIDFTGFCDRFGNFYNVVSDIWIDGWTDRWTEQWTDRQNNWRTDH